MSTGRAVAGDRLERLVRPDRCSVLRDRGRKTSVRRASVKLENCTRGQKEGICAVRAIGRGSARTDRAFRRGRSSPSR